MLPKSYNFVLSILFVSFLTFFYLFRVENIDFILYFKDIILGLNILVLFFTLFFDRSKIFLYFITILFYYLYMFYPSTLGLEGGNYSFWYIYPITLSLMFLLISPLQERGVFNLYGLLKFITLFVLLILSYYLLKKFDIDLKNSLNIKIFWFDFPKELKIYQVGLLLLSISLIFSAISSFIIYKIKIEYVSFWILIFLSCPILFIHTKSSFLFSLLFVAGIVLYTILKDAYDMAYIDTLTQIPSRRALEEEFLKLGRRYTLAMVDIDFFKKFNDTYGHDIGDEVLKLVAKEIYSVRGGGKAFRYGGEEFTILFNGKNSSDCLSFLEEVRENIYKRGFIIRDKNRPKNRPKNSIKSQKHKRVKISISIGVASSPKDATTPDSVLKVADKMLYRAKEAGRNCVIVA